MGLLLSSHAGLVALVRPYRFARHLLNDMVQSILKCCVVLCSAASLEGDNSDGAPVFGIIAIDAVFVFCLLVSILYTFIIGKKRSPMSDFQTVRWLASATGSFLPKQPPL